MFGLLKTSSYKQKYIAQSNHIEREKSLKMNFLGNQTEQRKSEKLENEQIGIMKVSVCIKRNQKKKKKIIITRSVELSQTFIFYFYFLFFSSSKLRVSLCERERKRERESKKSKISTLLSLAFEENRGLLSVQRERFQCGLECFAEATGSQVLCPIAFRHVGKLTSELILVPTPK